MSTVMSRAPGDDDAIPRPGEDGAILRLDNVRRHFTVRGPMGQRRGAVQAVDGVSLHVQPGEVLAVVGESGCGKSTLGRLMLRLDAPDGGTVRFEGRDLGALSSRDLRAQRRWMQMIFQDPYASLDPRMTVGQAVEEPLRLHSDLTPAERRARVQALLARVGLRPEHADRWPHEFSGGQRQRIAIARALASGPRLIVGDEPVSALDVSVQAQVINLLQELIRELNLAFVLISHDLAVVRHVADRVAVMYLGRIVEEGATDAIFGNPRHPYTRALLSSVPGVGGAAPLQGDLPSPISPPSGCRFHTRCPHAQEVCSRDDPPLVAGHGSGDGHRAACHFQDTLPPMPPLREHRAGGERQARLQSFFNRAVTGNAA